MNLDDFLTKEEIEYITKYTGSAIDHENFDEHDKLEEYKRNLSYALTEAESRQLKNNTLTFDIKYRPRSLVEVVGQEYLISQLKDRVKIGCIDNYMFYGVYGTGKTSVARALAKDLFGHLWTFNYHEHNVPNGKNNLKTINKDVLSSASIVPQHTKFQIIFLDECDHLDNEAQGALKKIIEEYSEYNRFIFATNHPEKIKSDFFGKRVLPKEFLPIPKDLIKARLKIVCAVENIKADDDALEYIAENVKGELRYAIKLIDDIGRAKKVLTLNDAKMNLKPPIVSSSVTVGYVQLLIESVLRNDNYEVILKDLIDNKKYTVRNILNDVFYAMDRIKVDRDIKIKIIQQLGLYSYRISQNPHDEELQMRCFLYSISGLKANNPESQVKVTKPQAELPPVVSPVLAPKEVKKEEKPKSKKDSKIKGPLIEDMKIWE